MCLTGAVVASWSLTQEVAGSSPFYCSDKYFVTEFTFSKNSISRLYITKWLSHLLFRYACKLYVNHTYLFEISHKKRPYFECFPSQQKKCL